MRKLTAPHKPGHLAGGGPLQPPHFDNRSRGGVNKRRNAQAARNLAKVGPVLDPWSQVKR